MFGFYGAFSACSSIYLVVVVLVQNDSKARVGVGGGGGGRRSWMVSPLIHLHKGGLSFPHPFAFLTQTTIKPPALQGSLRKQRTPVEHHSSGWFKDTAGALQCTKPFPRLDPLSVPPLCHVKGNVSDQIYIILAFTFNHNI